MLRRCSPERSAIRPGVFHVNGYIYGLAAAEWPCRGTKSQRKWSACQIVLPRRRVPSFQASGPRLIFRCSDSYGPMQVALQSCRTPSVWCPDHVRQLGWTAALTVVGWNWSRRGDPDSTPCAAWGSGPGAYERWASDYNRSPAPSTNQNPRIAPLYRFLRLLFTLWRSTASGPPAALVSNCWALFLHGVVDSAPHCWPCSCLWGRHLGVRVVSPSSGRSGKRAWLHCFLDS